ncbi:MAG: hypothetical protein FDX21_11525 [Chlorobium sp.]|nr:MAG: hypothetical protein FDX21_11525 [Chlorobium sp.]
MRQQSFRAPALWCLLLFVFLSGCGSSQQYASFARDGAAYTGAVAALADRASAVRVESSSFSLLQQRDALSRTYKGMALKNALRDSIRYTNQSDLGAIGENLRSKDVAISLQKYFIALQELAESKAPDDISSKTSEIIEKLDDAMKTQFHTSVSLPSSVAPVVVSHITERALHKELIGRKTIILNALNILDGLLNAINREIDGQARNIRNARVALLIQPAYQDTTSASLRSLPDKELWVALRQKGMSGTAFEAEDKKAIADIKKSGIKFRELFMKMTKE